MPRPGGLSFAAQSVRPSIFARLSQKMASFRGEIFPLHIGDTHLVPPDEVRLSSAEEYGPDCYRYGPIPGAPELVDALVEKLRTRNRMTWVGRDNVQISAGATHGLFALARSVLDPGDEVLVPSPYWPLAQGILHLCGARPREVPFYQRLYADPGADPRALLEPHITSATAALYLISPNNPDGKVLSAAQLERVADLSRDHGLWILCDEVYEDYVYDVPAPLSIGSLEGMAEHTLTAFSFSKSHAMAGLRLGYAVGPAEVIATARKICNHTLYAVPLHLQRAARRALLHAEAFIAHARDEHRAAREEAVAAVRAPFFAPEGASYLFLDLGEFLPAGARDSVPVLERLLDAGVLLAPGEAFGQGFERHARLCFTSVPRDRLREALGRLNEALDGLRRR